MTLRLNPLSTSKGQKYSCEMCGSSALYACVNCRVTYYCSHQHQQTDWLGIHDKICELLGALRTLRPTLGSEDERERRNLTIQMSQHALIDLCKNESQKRLVQKQYELAIPGALQSLRFSVAVYGNGRIELVPAYLLLAESNLGLRRFDLCEQFLLFANWAVLKNPNCSNELKSQLYRNFGKLYAAQGRYNEALKQLSADCYYSSLESGPEHIDTAGGYFYLADVFLNINKKQEALTLYDKVIDIYYKFLINLRHRTNESINDYLSEAHIGETEEMLKTILNIRKKYLGEYHIATGEASYALGILKHITNNYNDAKIHYQYALNIYSHELGLNNQSTLAIIRALQDIPGIDPNQIKPQPINVQQITATASSNNNSRPATNPTSLGNNNNNNNNTNNTDNQQSQTQSKSEQSSQQQQQQPSNNTNNNITSTSNTSQSKPQPKLIAIEQNDIDTDELQVTEESTEEKQNVENQDNNNNSNNNNNENNDEEENNNENNGEEEENAEEQEDEAEEAEQGSEK